MKKNVFSIILGILVVSLSILSCNKDTTIENQSSLAEMQLISLDPTVIDSVIYSTAVMHNTYLANAYDDFNLVDTIITYSQGVDILKSNLSMFMGDAFYDSAISFATLCADVTIVDTEIENVINQVQQNTLLGNLLIYIENISISANNINDFNDSVMNYYNTYFVSGYSSDDIAIIKGICGVAMGSFEYWNNNLGTWQTLQDKKDDKDKKEPADKSDKEKVKDFVIADVAGFGVGGVALAAILSGLEAWSWD